MSKPLYARKERDANAPCKSHSSADLPLLTNNTTTLSMQRNPSRSPSPSSKRHKSFHESSDYPMSTDDTPMTGTSNNLTTHGPLDHDIHGPRVFHDNSITMNGSAQAMNGTSAPPMALQIKKLSGNAKAPTRGSKFAAGYDVYAAETKVVPARGKAMIGTGIAIAIPLGTCTSPLLLPSHSPPPFLFPSVHP